jgi:cytochrome c oxidase subunit 1
LFNHDYRPIDINHLVLTIAGYLIFISVVIFAINMLYSMKKGEEAEGNLWNSRSPEWQVPSPMPVHNYEHPFVVVGEPYDYGLPGSKYVEFSTNGSKHVEVPQLPEREQHH